MNWNSVAERLAGKVLGRMKKNPDGSYSHDEVVAALKKAVTEGLIYECDNWVLKRI